MASRRDFTSLKRDTESRAPFVSSTGGPGGAGGNVAARCQTEIPCRDADAQVFEVVARLIAGCYKRLRRTVTATWGHESSVCRSR